MFDIATFIVKLNLPPLEDLFIKPNEVRILPSRIPMKPSKLFSPPLLKFKVMFICAFLCAFARLLKITYLIGNPR